MEIGLIVLMIIIMMGGMAILIPSVFWTLNHIEDWVEKKYGNDNRKKFLKWVQYISVGLVIVSILCIFITIYLDPPFSSHTERVVTPKDKPFTYYLDHKDTI